MLNFKKKNKNRILNLLLLFPLLFQLIFNTAIQISANDYSYAPVVEDCAVEEESKDNSKALSGSGSAINAGDAGGEWTQEGTERYKIAKTLFEVLTRDYGLSGTSAAGWLGNVQSESRFNPSVVEAENGQNYAGRGYGLYQFTPGTKYLNSQFYKKGVAVEEEVRNQTAFVFASEINNGAYRSYLPNASSWFGLTGVDDIEDILDNNDPEKAMLIFFAVYERGDVAQMHRERRTTAAKIANEMFNKENIPADRSKWPNGSGSSNPANTANINGKSEKTSSTDECPQTKDKKKTAGGGAWGETGTGSHSQTGERYWKRDELPDEMKKFAVNPESIGLSWGNASGWEAIAYNGGQCTDFSASFSYKLWGLKQTAGNGMAVVNNWISAYGNKGKTDSPKNGAVFSSPPVASNPYGHTGIISHVFENGDILIVEQNVLGYSGDSIGQKYTWSYHLVPNGGYAGWSFYYPGDVDGANMNKNVKTLG